MWFSLFIVVLVLTITFFQGLQGLFTALINSALAILSAAVAFGYYENIYTAYLMDSLPNDGQAVALVGLFVATFAVLRVIVDLSITGNMKFPVAAERIGGGIFGLVTALIIVGVLATGFQMLDFGSSFLGFSRYEIVDAQSGQPIDFSEVDKDNRPVRSQGTLDWSQVEMRRRNTWFNPEGFTVSLVAHLSGNALGGAHNFATVYPDFLDTIHFANAGVADAMPNTVPADLIRRIAGWWNLPDRRYFKREWVSVGGRGEQRFTLEKSDPPPPGMKRIVVRVEFDRAKLTEAKANTVSPRQVRLVGRPSPSADAKNYYPTGVSFDQEPSRYHDLGEGEWFNLQPAAEGPALFDFVFTVPEGEAFEPLFIEFKLTARASFKPNQKLKVPMPPLGAENADQVPIDPFSGGGTPSSDNGQTRVPGAGNIAGIAPELGSRFSDQMPFDEPLSDYGGTADSRGRKMLGGRVVARLTDDWEPRDGSKPKLSAFDVPRGKALLQLNVNKLHAGSLLGQVLNFARDKTRDIHVIDDSGDNCRAVGVYAMAMAGGQPTFECIYLDQTERIGGRLPFLQTIAERSLKQDDVYVFLFLVDSGRQAVTLSTGSKKLDLKSQNLLAP